MEVRTRVRRRVGVVAAIGGAALVVLTLVPGDNESGGEPAIAGHGSGEVSEGSDHDQHSAGRTDQSPNPSVAEPSESTAGDSGLVNPWAAGSAAATRYLADLGRECMTGQGRDPDPNSE